MPSRAESALETLQALRRHTKDCPQCKTDTSFCNTYKSYADNFEKDYHLWEKERKS